jgi:quercetin dioxygenase-like cupin family protein
MSTWDELHALYPHLVLKPEVVFYHHRGHLVCLRRMSLPRKGNAALTHKHKDGHYSILLSGIVELTVDGQKTTHAAPSILWVKEELNHSIVALSDNVEWLCIHPVPPELADTDTLGPDAMDEVIVKE